MKAIQAIYMVYRPCDLYESDSSPCDINHQKDYTAWTSYDKNNFLLLFIHLNKVLQKFFATLCFNDGYYL
jgi:hypothetical protein